MSQQHIDTTPPQYAVVNGRPTGYRTCSCGHVIKTDRKYVDEVFARHAKLGY